MKYWSAVLSALNGRERILVSFVAAVALVALIFWVGALYVHSTREVPDTGGTYAEGVLGQPLYINPLLSQSGGPDADLSRLVYSGLFTHDTQGKLQKDLAQDYAVSEDRKTYTVILRQGVKWHDGEELTADDVAYTFRIVQDAAYKSPLRANWQGVAVGVVDRYAVSFTLTKPYFGFLENLTTGILPKHVWENVDPEKFSLTDANLSPVGTGPYMASTFKKDSSGNILTFDFKAFPEYFGGTPYISKIVFHFYPTEDLLVDAYDRREVMGIGSVSPKTWEHIKDRKSIVLHEMRQPRIFAVFFNDKKNVPLGYLEVRQALSMAIDRDKIVQTVLAGHGESLGSPFLPGMPGYDDGALIGYDPARAAEILDNAGWTMDGDVRKKDGVDLAFQLVTPDWPDLVETSEELKEEWQSLGVRVDVQTVGVADLQQTIVRPREYQALLFGEVSGFDPDPYSFWHSSQKSDPGTNFALFDDKEADDALAVARETVDTDTRAEQYRIFLGRIRDLVPAVFLYAPHYLYVMDNEVKGVAVDAINVPNDRFSDVAHWYMETRRVKN